MARALRRMVASVLLVLDWSAVVHAADEPPAPAPLPEGARTLLPPVPELRLRWPLAPRQFSFSAAEVPGYANGPLRLFKAESLWLSAGNLRLMTIGSVERATELDCRLTCQPVLAQTASLEARFNLPRVTDAVPSAYGFLRAGSYRPSSSGRSAGLIKTGIAGSFNF